MNKAEIKKRLDEEARKDIGPWMVAGAAVMVLGLILIAVIKFL